MHPTLLGMMACKLYEQLRREAAALKIQKNFRRFMGRKSYLTVRSSAMTIQTGLRAMKARNEFRLRKQTKASIIIQVSYHKPQLQLIDLSKFNLHV